MASAAEKTVRRYRGKEIILLRRMKKVIDEITRHNLKYPQGPPPAPAVRRHLKFNEFDYGNMSALVAKCNELLPLRWPPPEES